MESLKLNSLSPSFKAYDQNENLVELKEFNDQWVLVYFYPKAMTPGCKIQACHLRDHLSKFNKLDCKVIGISPDSPKRLKKFEEKEGLNFTLISDEDFSIAKKYKVYGLKKFMGREFMGVKRTSFILSPGLKIAFILEDVKTKTHHEEVLKKLKELKA